VAASAALTISGVPFMGRSAAARVGYKDGEYQLNPSWRNASRRARPVVAATQDAVMMVESEAKELSEEVMLGAGHFAHEASRKVIDAIIRLPSSPPRSLGSLSRTTDHAAVKQQLRDLIGADLAAAYKLTDKQQRQTAVNEARAKAARHSRRPRTRTRPPTSPA
jgi:polyribonucleotide nucleotidyltransferase